MRRREFIAALVGAAAWRRRKRPELKERPKRPGKALT
jgi:hypothetical protein